VAKPGQLLSFDDYAQVIGELVDNTAFCVDGVLTSNLSVMLDDASIKQIPLSARVLCSMMTSDTLVSCP